MISILDFFGFEDFSENSFEQLCVNYADEALQHAFNKHVFKQEQAEYAREKVEWTPIPYSDNGPVVHMISKKPIGIFHLLDDESNFPKVGNRSTLRGLSNLEIKCLKLGNFKFVRSPHSQCMGTLLLRNI